jgi:putative DNA primase/helicase
MPALRERVRLLPGLKVVLIDSIVSSVGGDSHNNAETRRGLQPVVDFATDTGAAVLGITHFTKGTQGKNPTERITGSLAFAALARVAWGASVGDDPSAPRKLVRVKNNIEQNGGGFEFTLLQDHVRGHAFTAQRVAWGSAIEGSAQALLQGGEGSKEAQAIRLLESLLRPAGTAGILRNDLKVHAEDAGLSWVTLERAKRKMGNVESFKGLGSNQAPWYWRLLHGV